MHNDELRGWRVLGRLTLSLTIAVGCGSSASDAPGETLREPAIWQTGRWPSTTPEEQGLDAGRLAELVRLVRARAADLHMHSLLVVRHGAIVLDVSFFPYDGVRPHDIASCTKSLTSLAIGLALGPDADTRLETPLTTYYADPAVAIADTLKSAMTLKDALTMTSGMACDEPASLVAMQTTNDWLGYAWALPMVAVPGQTFRYCSTVSHLLSGVVSRSASVAADELLRNRVFEPTGVGDVLWPRDPQGVSHGWGDARMMPADLARIGLLMLHRGRWGDRQIIAPSWVDAATHDQLTTSDGSRGYGLHWWATANGAFYGTGRGGQYLYVVPDRDLLVVSTGSADPDGEGEYATVLQTALIPAIIADSALPANGAADQALLDVTRAALEPDASAPAATVPGRASALAGRWYEAGSNPLGWEGMSLMFSGPQAILTLRWGADEFPLAIGLDEVPRINRGVRFAAPSRYAKVDVALVGHFVDDGTFAIAFDTIDGIDAGTITLALPDAEGPIGVDVFERTFLREHLVFSAQRAP